MTSTCLISFSVILLIEFLSQLQRYACVNISGWSAYCKELGITVQEEYLSIAILMPWLGDRPIDLLELIFRLTGRGGYMVELLFLDSFSPTGASKLFEDQIKTGFCNSWEPQTIEYSLVDFSKPVWQVIYNSNHV